MKMDFDKFKEAAGGASETVIDGAAEGAAEAVEPAPSAEPSMGVRMGPDGTEIDVQAPLGEMDPKEAIEFAQELQGPDLSEQILDLLKDPEIRRAAKVLWEGQGGSGQSQGRPVETVEANPEPMTTKELTDGGEPAQELPDDVYQITPGGFVVVLETMLPEVAKLKPDLTVSEMPEFIDKYRDDIETQIGLILEDLDE